VVCSIPALAVAESNSETKSVVVIMREMRLRWLTEWSTGKSNSEEIGISAQSDKISAVIMDWPIRDQVATVLASSGGDASLYTTAGFGIIGGIDHENVRKAAVALIDHAYKYLTLAKPTTDYSYAAAGQIKFFFVLPKGVSSLMFTSAQTEQPHSPAGDLFIHAQQVVTELRLIAPHGTRK
jgi:hypothetical protein